MEPNRWPWSIEEEAKWEQQLRIDAGSIEEIIDDMVNNALAGVAYDPLQTLEQASEEELVVP